jgi:hypothetical protein
MMNHLFQKRTRWILATVGLLGVMSFALASVQAYYNPNYYGGVRNCVPNVYGHCVNQPTGYSGAFNTPVQQINYPHAQVNTPAPTFRTDLDPVQQHAQWMNNRRRYEEVNELYNRVPNGIGGYLTRPAGAIRPYPSYADYAYRQERAAKQQWGSPAPTVYSQQIVGSTRIVNTDAFRKPRLYITQEQANAYDRLYELGVTTRRRPENAVVGRRPQPHPDSRFGY